jgi:hypothetical protein
MTHFFFENTVQHKLIASCQTEKLITIMKLLFYLIIPAALFSSCEKDRDAITENIKGKLIVKNCGYPVVQILDSNYFHLAQPTWSRDGQDHIPPITNVFLVTNPCSVENAELNEGEEFTFRVVRNARCAIRCDILMLNPPTTKHAISVK